MDPQPRYRPRRQPVHLGGRLRPAHPEVPAHGRHVLTGVLTGTDPGLSLACDCHVHVFGPAARFPLDAQRSYTPPEAPLEELRALQQRLGLERVVVVQPSPYGTDNSCTLDAIARLGGRARGVAVIDSNSDIEELHGKGMRGVRVNLQTAGIQDPATAQRLLDEAASRIHPGWHVQVFTNLRLLKKISFRKLKASLVIDHFGVPQDAADAAFLLSLMANENLYVKLSGPHLCGADLRSLTPRLVAAAPERCLWGSNWPHPYTGKRDPREVQPFDRVDEAAELERLRGWVGSEALFRKILVDNPARLYDF